MREKQILAEINIHHLTKKYYAPPKKNSYFLVFAMKILVFLAECPQGEEFSLNFPQELYTQEKRFFFLIFFYLRRSFFFYQNWTPQEVGIIFWI